MSVSRGAHKNKPHNLLTTSILLEVDLSAHVERFAVLVRWDIKPKKEARGGGVRNGTECGVHYAKHFQSSP